MITGFAFRHDFFFKHFVITGFCLGMLKDFVLTGSVLWHGQLSYEITFCFWHDNLSFGRCKSMFWCFDVVMCLLRDSVTKFRFWHYDMYSEIHSYDKSALV